MSLARSEEEASRDANAQLALPSRLTAQDSICTTSHAAQGELRERPLVFYPLVNAGFLLFSTTLLSYVYSILYRCLQTLHGLLPP